MNSRKRHGGPLRSHRSRPFALLGLMLLAWVGGVRTAWATDTTTTPYPGVTWIYRNTATQKINVLKIDLTQRTFRIRATKPPDLATHRRLESEPFKLGDARG